MIASAFDSARCNASVKETSRIMMFWDRLATGVLSFLAIAGVTTEAILAQQGQPQIGIAPVVVANEAYTFDTAEQHKSAWSWSHAGWRIRSVWRFSPMVMRS